jgi:integrase
MSKKSLMTWVEKTKRWAKKYKGKNYAVSAAQLNCPATEAASREAANLWWVAKQGEIDASDRKEIQNRNAAWLYEQHLAGRSWEELAPLVLGQERIDQIRQDAAAFVDAYMDRVSGGQDAATVVDAYMDRVSGKPLPTLATLADEWAALQQARSRAGEIDQRRADSYGENLAVFVRQVGGETIAAQINAVTLERYHTWVLGQIGQRREWLARGDGGPRQGIAPAYGQVLWSCCKTFLRWVYERGVIELPRNFNRLKVSVKASDRTIPLFRLSELRTLVEAAATHKPKFYCWLLVMLNCGYCQNDLSELDYSELDLKKGIIRRARSKTWDRGGVVRTYKLWPETIAALKEFRNRDLSIKGDCGKPLVLTTDTGGRLVQSGRCDNIRSAYRHLVRKAGLTCAKPLKALRKTMATLIGRYPPARGVFVDHFLGHSPRSMAARHYNRLSSREFFRALRWLRRVILRPGKTEEEAAE